MFHPDLEKIFQSSEHPVCPICQLAMVEDLPNTSMRCSDRLCHQASGLRINLGWEPNTRYASRITFTTSRDIYQFDKLVFMELFFEPKTISMVLAPEHKRIGIPWFDIDWSRFDALPKKIQLYLTLS